MPYFYQKTLFYWQEALGIAHPKNSYKIALFSLNRFLQPTSILLVSAHLLSFIFFPGEKLTSSLLFFFIAVFFVTELIKISTILFSIGFMRPSVGLKNKSYSSYLMPQKNKTIVAVLSLLTVLGGLLLSRLSAPFAYLYFSISSLVASLTFLFYRDNNRETGLAFVHKTALFAFFHLPFLCMLFCLTLLPSCFLVFINSGILRAIILLLYAVLLTLIQAILVTVYTQRIHEQPEYYL